MNEFYSISDYCSIRDHEVVLQGRPVYSDPGTPVREFLTGIYRHFAIQYPKFYKMDNLSKLGFLTVDLLLMNKNILQQYGGNKVGIILLNASSSLDTDRHHQSSIVDRNNYFPSPAVFVYTLPNIVIGEISIRHKITGEGTFFVQEKFNPSFAVNYIRQLLDGGIIQCCIAGWVETEGNDYESVFYLIEKTGRPNSGIANFEPASIQRIYDKVK